MEPGGGLLPAEALVALDHLPLSVSLVDVDGAIRYLNPAGERLYGLRADRVIGQSALALSVGPTETPAAAELLSRLRLGQSWSGRFPVTRVDGTRLTAWVAVVPVPGVHGRPGGNLIVSADTRDLDADLGSVRDLAETWAEEANLLVEGLLHSVPVGMAFFDRNLRYVRVNAALAEINGLPPEHHVGRSIGELLRGIPHEVADDIRSVFASGRTIPQREVVGETPKAPGVARHWMVSYYPVTRAGEVLWVGTTMLDVTEWRLAEAERARLLDAERQARQAAEQAAERLARLQILTGRLAEASDRASIAEIVVTHGCAGVGASGAALCVVAGDHLDVIASAGMDPAAVRRLQHIPVGSPVPTAEAVRRRALISIGSLADRDRLYPALAGLPALNRSFVAVPMLVEGHAIGCLAFGWPEERAFPETERAFLLALGRQAAQALERARLYEAEREARAAAEKAGERMTFLAEASRVLSSSLDYEVTLAELARLAVPEVADACTVHLVEAGDLRLVVAAHRDPTKQGDMARVSGRPFRRPVLLARVAVTGQALLVPEVPDSLWREMAEDDDHLAELRSLDVHSLAVVPLRVQDRVLGILALALGGSGRRYSSDDLPFVEDLAGRAAVAIENARSHTARTEVAQTLQRSLLPPHLPEIPGLDLAQRYHSVGDVEVGGDFYDVFPAGDGRWSVVIGDVCGKGVGAASLTALARYTVRAAAIGERQPTQVLRLLNRAILESDVGERFCTVVHAVIEPGTCDVGVTLACGGHPLPLLLTPEGDVRPVGLAGTAIGLFEDVSLAQVEIRLQPGHALVLYTDGFVEVRSPDGEFAPDLLARALATAAGQPAEGIAAKVDLAVQAFQGGHLRDDMALLILKVPARP